MNKQHYSFTMRLRVSTVSNLRWRTDATSVEVSLSDVRCYHRMYELLTVQNFFFLIEVQIQTTLSHI